MARNEKLLNASKNALEPALITNIIYNKFEISKKFLKDEEIINCRLANEKEDKIDKGDIYFETVGGKIYRCNVKTREQYSENFSVNKIDLNKNAFIFFYEYGFTNNELDELNLVGGTLKLRGKKIYMINRELLVNNIMKDKGDYYVFDNNFVIKNSVEIIIQ